MFEVLRRSDGSARDLEKQLPRKQLRARRTVCHRTPSPEHRCLCQGRVGRNRGGPRATPLIGSRLGANPQTPTHPNLGVRMPGPGCAKLRTPPPLLGAVHSCDVGGSAEAGSGREHSLRVAEQLLATRPGEFPPRRTRRAPKLGPRVAPETELAQIRPFWPTSGLSEPMSARKWTNIDQARPMWANIGPKFGQAPVPTCQFRPTPRSDAGRTLSPSLAIVWPTSATVGGVCSDFGQSRGPRPIRRIGGSRPQTPPLVQHPFQKKAGWSPEVRALRPDEFLDTCGGPPLVSLRKIEYLGPMSEGGRSVTHLAGFGLTELQLGLMRRGRI